jgi:NADH:ubiquinone oxidoreductase subunit 4 (subunit M)
MSYDLKYALGIIGICALVSIFTAIVTALAVLWLTERKKPAPQIVTKTVYVRAPASKELSELTDEEVTRFWAGQR